MAYTPNWKFLDGAGYPRVLSGKSAQGITEVGAAQNYALGTRVKGVDPVFGEAEFVYCKGVASLTAGEPVVVGADFVVARATGGTAKGNVGISMSAFDAATKFGFVCVKGRTFGTIAADVAAAAQASIVANVWSSAATSTKYVWGAMIDAGLDAGGSAIPGTTELTPAHKACVYLNGAAVAIPAV